MEHVDDKFDQARQSKSCRAKPPHCREAAPQASETSFALFEGTQEIVLITPGSVLQGSRSKGVTVQTFRQLHDAAWAGVTFSHLPPIRLWHHPAEMLVASPPQGLQCHPKALLEGCNQLSNDLLAWSTPLRRIRAWHDLHRCEPLAPPTLPA